MRHVVMAVLLLVLKPVLGAHADDLASAIPSINVLTSTPSVIAVSSTVANSRFLPEHLVDGEPGTAWNSRTGDLQGAWVEVDALAVKRITAIRLYAGFARIENGQDLFLMNPRIRKVRIWPYYGKPIERTLDPDDRQLQEITVDLPLGYVRIEVIEIVPGTKPAWREICISELEVWGVLFPDAASVPSKPIVRVGSLDPRSAHDTNTESDLARIRVAWNSIRKGSRVGLAYPFFTEVHDVAYLDEPMCSYFVIDLDSAKTSPDAEAWRCLGVLANHLLIPDHMNGVRNSWDGWFRPDSPPKDAGARAPGTPDSRTYRGWLHVSAYDVLITIYVNARGVVGLVLDLQPPIGGPPCDRPDGGTRCPLGTRGEPRSAVHR
jgi:hypothetical protein